MFRKLPADEKTLERVNLKLAKIFRFPVKLWQWLCALRIQVHWANCIFGKLQCFHAIRNDSYQIILFLLIKLLA
jgi:hypothetical protein